MSIDFRLRDFFHPYAIWRLHRDFERNQWREPSELGALRNSRLAAMVDHALLHVPFYRELGRRLDLRPGDVKQPQDLAVFPVLRKDVLRLRRHEFTADNVDTSGAREVSTSGTSGEPVRLLMDRDANCLEFVYYWRHWGWGGFRLGDKFAELGSHYFLTRPRLGDRPWCWQPHLRRLILNSGRLSSASAREMAAAVNRFRPRFLKGTASSLYFFARSLQDAGINHLEFRCVFSTGESLLPAYRKVMEEVFGCRALDSYGHMERTVAVSECPEGGLHINTDYGVLQIDAEGDGNGSGGYPVLGTGLHNWVMPLIRYEVGDQVELEDGSCPCGRSFPLVRRLLGRSRDVIITPDGRYVTTLFLVPELVDGVDFVQFRQITSDRLMVSMVSGPGWSEASGRQILEYTTRLLGEGVTLQTDLVSSVDRLRDRSGKLRVVIGLDE